MIETKTKRPRLDYQIEPRHGHQTLRHEASPKAVGLATTENGCRHVGEIVPLLLARIAACGKGGRP